MLKHPNLPSIDREQNGSIIAVFKGTMDGFGGAPNELCEALESTPAP